MVFEIEKGVEIPERYKWKTQEMVYPFQKMEVGDSFLIPCEKYLTETTRSTVVSRHALYMTQGRLEPGFKISTRSVDEGLRVWRVGNKECIAPCPGCNNQGRKCAWHSGVGVHGGDVMRCLTCGAVFEVGGE